MSTKRISIFGSTGSIGQSTLAVIEHANARGPVYEVDVLAAGSNVAELAEQAIAHRASLAVIADESKYGELAARLEGHGIAAAAGDTALIEAAGRPVHRLVAAIVGVAGLPSTLAALQAGVSVALANKESLICAGDLMKLEARKSGADLIPMDSEHSAIFQVLHDRDDVEKLTLTASGGPFLNTSKADMAGMSVADARNHPRWSMGLKISIDSATMMNKALEVIEAAYLFNKTAEDIDVVVHPQSIIHSMVSYNDGSVLAQLGVPDMRTPIAYALAWPDQRIETEVKRLDLATISRLDFETVDSERFPAITLSKQSLTAGGSAPLILNVANEVAVSAFIASACRFTDISYIVEASLEEFSRRGFENASLLSLNGILQCQDEGECVAKSILNRLQA